MEKTDQAIETAMSFGGSTNGSRFLVKVCWDAVTETREGFFEKFFHEPPPEYDLDLSAILCGRDGRAVDAVYYASPSYRDGVVSLLGDNRYGRMEGASWDGEEMTLNLDAAPSDIEMIDIVINMHDAVKSEHHFPQLKNASARLISVDSRGETTLLRRDISEEKYMRKHGMVFCRFFRSGASWKFEERYETFDDNDGSDLQAIVDKYQ
jgi:stress response protein SCP2